MRHIVVVVMVVVIASRLLILENFSLGSLLLFVELKLVYEVLMTEMLVALVMDCSQCLRIKLPISDA